MGETEQLSDRLKPLVAAVNEEVKGFADDMGTVFGDAAITLAQKMEEEFGKQLRDRDELIAALAEECLKGRRMLRPNTPHALRVLSTNLLLADRRTTLAELAAEAPEGTGGEEKSVSSK